MKNEKDAEWSGDADEVCVNRDSARGEQEDKFSHLSIIIQSVA